jgi:D-ribose pyranase
MKKSNILNPDLISVIAALGHTQYLVIADAGLPVPEGVSTIDLSVSRGIPSFHDVLQAVCSELVVESYIYATEIEKKNLTVFSKMSRILGDINSVNISHEEFKTMTAKANCIIRTGECSPYANVILVGGVNF